MSLKHAFEARGGVWDDAPVAGGGGDAMAAVLRARVLAGVPPSVAQVKGQNIKEWAAVGALEGSTQLQTSKTGTHCCRIF
ncbi:hypothetical protein [Pseudovibrio denitrificans]|uniref:hypothetical protein n=1 Tax=Pseudovibrio denitrificans TaxID=258256 RepID=UPI001AD93ECC|nr:hypothetical protein [Pseudovibrio denitrificans]